MPLYFYEEGIDQKIAIMLRLPARNADLSGWKKLVQEYTHLKYKVKIGIVGKYVELEDAYLSVKEALLHAGLSEGWDVQIEWISSESLEKGRELKLPKTEGQADKPVRKEDVQTVEITAQGVYALKGRPLRLDLLIRELVADFRLNPNLVVYIRADENSRTRELAALISGCQQNGITRYSLRTQPPERR